MKLAVVCDFDDTVAEQNVAEVLLERFGSDGWRELRRSFREGLLTLKEYQEKAFATVHQPKATLEAFVKTNTHPRPHFQELVRFCEDRGMPLAIASNGLDFYVQAFLAKLGLNGTIPCHCVATSFDRNGRISYAYTPGLDGCYQWSQCKCLVLEEYRRQGYYMVFVGDGASDICPAQRADHVMARGRLLEFCRTNSTPHSEFSDFSDVIRVVRDRSSR